MTENPTVAFKGTIRNIFRGIIVKPYVDINPPVQLISEGSVTVVKGAIVPPQLISQFQEVGMAVEGTCESIAIGPGQSQNMVVTMKPSNPSQG